MIPLRKNGCFGDTMTCSQLLRALAWAAVFAPAIACAQAPSTHDRATRAQAEAGGLPDSNSLGVSMSGALMQGAHLEMTPSRTPTPADELRAARVLAELRNGITRYADYGVAEAEGYKQFLPNVPQKLYHFTNYRRSIGEAFKFEPARPSSLLYEKTRNGAYKLVGAMYHAPRRASLEKLDERIPLSIARWHRHINICVPARGDSARWKETRNGAPLFGPRGTIGTEKECDASGGRFVEHLFGWMVHVNVFASDPRSVWGSEGGGGNHDHGRSGH